MQDPKTSHLRKPWYQRALEMATLWRTITNSTESPKKNTASLWKILSSSKLRDIRKNNAKNVGPDKLKKCTSLRLASSLTRVCLCAPMSSYTEVFRAEIPPPTRRNNTYPRSKSYSIHHDRIPTPIPVPAFARLSTDQGRRIFRGKSLTDDVLMRRFVVEEEAMIRVRRRNEMELIRKRSLSRRRKIGPSPLNRMVLAVEE